MNEKLWRWVLLSIDWYFYDITNEMVHIQVPVEDHYDLGGEG